MRPLVLGVIGCGGIAQMMHLPHLAERPDLFRVAALADVDAEALEAMGRRYGVADLCSSHLELLERPLEAVLIASSGSHCQLALDCLRAGKHVLVEKPLGESRAEVEKVAREVEGTGLTLMVGVHKRYDPGYRYAREVIRGLRDLRMVRVEVLHPVDAAARLHHPLVPPIPPARLEALRAEEDYPELVKRLASGGALDEVAGPEAPPVQRVAAHLIFNSLIHDVNAVRGILGEPEEVLSAEFWQGGRCMHIVVRWSPKLRVSFSWLYLPRLSHYHEEMVFLDPGARVRLVFPSPYLRHFPTPVVVETEGDGGYVSQRHVVSYEEAFRAELLRFHDCATTGAPPETGVEDALADADLMERMVRAFRRRP